MTLPLAENPQPAKKPSLHFSLLNLPSPSCRILQNPGHTGAVPGDLCLAWPSCDQDPFFFLKTRHFHSGPHPPACNSQTFVGSSSTITTLRDPNQALIWLVLITLEISPGA